MKTILTGIALLTSLSALASSNCTYFIKSDLGSRNEWQNSFHYEMDQVLSGKGYTKIYVAEDAGINIVIKSRTKTSVKENFITTLKDMFDRDTESDYFIKYDNRTEIRVISKEGNELLSGIKEFSGETIDNYLGLSDSLAVESVNEAAIVLTDMPECRE